MRRIRTAVLLAATLFAAARCSGADLFTADSAGVVGRWLVEYPANDGAHTEQRLTFGADGSYASELLWIGFYGRPADEVTGYLRTRGQYRVRDGVLMLRIERQEEWQKYAVGPNPAVSTPRPVWGDHGTVRVEGDRLIHTFVSAPADAPETFTVTYRRER